MSRSLLTAQGSVVSKVLAQTRRARRGVCAAAAKAAVETLEARMMLSSTWFVSPSGSNQNPGTLEAPFQTIQVAANNAQAGDVVEIEGGVYHETVTVPHSGTAAAPITFEPYNSESVTIDGADAISGWTSTGGSIYTASMNWDLGDGNNQVFVDGKMMNEARWPNTSLDISHPTLATVASAANSTDASTWTSTIKDSALTQPAGFWVGSTISMGAGQNWVMSSGDVTGSGPGWLTFTYIMHAGQNPTAGNRFYLSGKSGALDSAGEWFRAADGTLSLWTPGGDDPDNHVVEAKARKYGFDLRRSAYINIQGIHLFACTIITGAVSRGVHINQITAEYLSQFGTPEIGWNVPNDSGIWLGGAGDTLANSVIAFSAGNGVFVTGPNSRVTNNLIHDVDYQGTNNSAVGVGASNVLVDHNTIYNAGRDGIYLHAIHDSITANVIHDFGLINTDCGGVYTCSMDGGGTEISYNTVYNGMTAGFGATALYLDNNSSGFTIDHNITYNVNFGVTMNYTSLNNTIVNNTLDATRSSVNKTWGAYDWSGTVIQNNIFTRVAQFGVNDTISNNVTMGSAGFVNMAARDYELADGAVAIGAGMRTAPYMNAFGGSAPDAGAIAYGATPFADGAKISLLPADPSAIPAPPVPTPPTPPVESPKPISSAAKPTSATSDITALDFDAQHGVATASLGGLGYNFAGNWVEYSNVDFGAGVSQVTFQFAVANAYAGNTVVLRLDSPTGPTIGSLVASGTGGWATYTAQTTAITAATGVHSLYLCMEGDGPMGNITTFSFA